MGHFDSGRSIVAAANSRANQRAGRWSAQSDIIAATMRSVTVFRRQGSGFAPASGSPFMTPPGPYRIALGDVDENGAPDVAVSSFDGNSVTLLLGRMR
jgi:hypothetical protein